MTKSTITNKDGQIQLLVGPDAIEAMRLRTIIVGIGAEKRGMRLTRGANCTKMAQEIIQQVTGLKYKRTERDEMMHVMQLILDAQVAKCDVINLTSKTKVQGNETVH